MPAMCGLAVAAVRRVLHLQHLKELGFVIMSRLQTMLAEKHVLLADGATGTSMFAMGLQSGDAPEGWNFDHPDRVRKHYRSFIDAGSDIVLTNTFGGTANRLKLHNMDDRVFEINKTAAELLCAEIQDSGRDVLCAGSVGPTGDLFIPLGPLSHEDGVAAFTAQVEGLKAGGADVAWIETMSSEEEFNAALEAAANVGLPAVCTLSFDTNGRTMMGVTPARFVECIYGHNHAPLAFGGNCGTGASDLMAGLLSMQESLTGEEIIVAKANCGIPEYVDGAIEYSGTPELMADYTRMALNLGARIIGGCCGTSPVHIAAMRQVLDETSGKGEKPTLETIISSLGPLTGTTESLMSADANTAPQARFSSGRRRRR